MARESNATWAKRVERWMDSGLTARDFAAEIGVNANTLVHWKWRLGERRRDRSPSSAPSTALAFVEVTAPAPGPVSVTPPETAEPPPRPPASTSPEPLEVVLAGGVRIGIPVGGFDSELLRRVVAALEVR